MEYLPKKIKTISVIIITWVSYPVYHNMVCLLHIIYYNKSATHYDKFFEFSEKSIHQSESNNDGVGQIVGHSRFWTRKRGTGTPFTDVSTMAFLDLKYPLRLEHLQRLVLLYFKLVFYFN